MCTGVAFELTFEWSVVWKENSGEEHGSTKNDRSQNWEGDMAK